MDTGGLDIIFGPLALPKDFFRRFFFFFGCAVIIDVALNVKDRTTELSEAHYFIHLRIGGPRKLSVPMGRGLQLWETSSSNFKKLSHN